MVLILALPRPASGQMATRLAPNDRLILRGFLLPIRGLKVQVLEDRGDTVLVQPDAWPESLTLPIRHIHRVQISRGKQANTGTGMLSGFLAGLVVGFGLGNSHDVESALYGGLAGLVLGGATGAAIRTEKWGPVVPFRPARSVQGARAEPGDEP